MDREKKRNVSIRIGGREAAPPTPFPDIKVLETKKRERTTNIKGHPPRYSPQTAELRQKTKKEKHMALPSTRFLLKFTMTNRYTNSRNELLSQVYVPTSDVP